VTKVKFDLEDNTSQPEVLLICIGNDYRQDDGAGLVVGRHLRIRGLKGIKVLENSGDGMALMDAWKNCDTVILVDAVQSGWPAGTIFYFDALKHTLPEDMFPVSSHNIGIPQCITLSRNLGLLPKKLIFYGIEGRNFAEGQTLSRATHDAANEVAEKIAEELRWRGF